MATPPTSNCDDVSQDSSGAFSFNQNIKQSTNNSNSKLPVDNELKNGNLAQNEGSNILQLIV